MHVSQLKISFYLVKAHMLQESCDEVTIPHLCGSEPWMPSIGDHGEGHAAEGHAPVHPRAILGIMYISEMPSMG